VSIDRVALLHSAEKLLRQGKLDQAIAEYRRAVDDQPRDWTTANALGDLYVRAGQIDRAVETYLRIADNLAREGFLPKAGALYKKILKIRPHDEYVLLQAAEIAASQELLVDARAYLNAVCEQRRSRRDSAGVAAITIKLATLDRSDIEARLAGARAQVETGELSAAVSALKQLAAELTEPGRLDQAVMVLREGERLAPTDPEIKSSLIRILAGRSDQKSADEAARLAIELSEAAAARGDWATAVTALQQSLKRSPNDISVLLRLVEVSVDGGLHDIATSAQGQLVDAHLRAGSPLEARFIAEDLVARHSHDPAHLERLRRALTMGGEPNPEAVMAARLSGLELVVPDAPDEEEPAEAPAPTVVRRPEPSAEVDLSGALDGIKFPQEMPRLPQLVAGATDVQPTPSKDLDDVFADLRAEATRRVAANNP
jgi:tetratricopeptide (TPR) repeat protein